MINSCKKSTTRNNSQQATIPTQTCDTTGSISFSSQVAPIINVSCGVNSGACHGSGASNGDLTTYAGVHIHVAGGMLLHAVMQDQPSVDVPMPLAAAKLSDCNIAKIKKWIDQGALNN